MRAAVTALRCRTSEFDARAAEGAVALARELGLRWEVPVDQVGEFAPPPCGRAGWQEDLRGAAGCLRRAGERIVFDEGSACPLLVAGHCTIALSTLPEVARRRPAALVLWIDAHGDFNSPATSPSGFLGGMCLSAPCGVWDSGFGAGLDPHQVVLCGARDLDPGERELLAAAEVHQASTAAASRAVTGREVFLHLDLDVLDPSVLPGGAFPVPGGLGLDELEALLGEIAAGSAVVGVEITNCSAAERAAAVAEAVVRGLDRRPSPPAPPR